MIFVVGKHKCFFFKNHFLVYFINNNINKYEIFKKFNSRLRGKIHSSILKKKKTVNKRTNYTHLLCNHRDLCVFQMKLKADKCNIIRRCIAIN